MAYDSLKVSETFLVYSEDKVTVSHDFPNVTDHSLPFPLTFLYRSAWAPGSPAALLGGLYP